MIVRCCVTGLGLAAKVDPAQKEKEEARAWLTVICTRMLLILQVKRKHCNVVLFLGFH